MNISQDYPKKPGWHRMAPGTSRAAAEAMVTAATLRAACSEVLRERDCTADEVAEALGASVLSVRPRITELLRAGQVEDTGKRRRNASWRQAVVWRWVVTGQADMFDDKLSDSGHKTL